MLRIFKKKKTKNEKESKKLESQENYIKFSFQNGCQKFLRAIIKGIKNKGQKTDTPRRILLWSWQKMSNIQVQGNRVIPADASLGRLLDLNTTCIRPQ